MANALSKKTILITRPADQSSYLHELLKREGANVIALPTIEIFPEKSTTISPVIQQLNEYAIVIFTSVNAVKHSIQLLNHYWSSLPPNIQLAAIGASTKQALEKQGWQCNIFPETNFSSEGLLELEFFHTIKNKNILIITGKNGRDYLANTLKSRQALVTEVLCYERKMPKYSNLIIIDLTKHKIDFIVCTSNESLENLAKILGDSLLKKFEQAQIIAFSNRIKNLAKHLGFIKTPIITTTPSDIGIVTKLRETHD